MKLDNQRHRGRVLFYNVPCGGVFDIPGPDGMPFVCMKVGLMQVPGTYRKVNAVALGSKGYCTFVRGGQVVEYIQDVVITLPHNQSPVNKKTIGL